MFQKEHRMRLYAIEPIKTQHSIKTNLKDRVRKGFRDSSFGVFVLLRWMQVMSQDKQFSYKSNNADRVH